MIGEKCLPSLRRRRSASDPILRHSLVRKLETEKAKFRLDPWRSLFSAASAVRETIRLRMSKKRAETRTINVKQTIEKRMSRTIEQNG